MLQLVNTVKNQVKEYQIPTNYEKYVGEEIAGSPNINVEYVKIEDMILPELQRDLNIKDVLKYVKNKGGIDWNLFGVPTVWRKPGSNTINLINGQHRITAVVLFLPHITEIKCHVIETESQKEASRYFSDMNGMAQRQLSAEDIFNSAVIGEYPEALYHRDIMLKADVSCGKVNRDAASIDRKEIKYANFKKALADGGEENTIRAIELCRTAYPNKTMNDVMYAALAQLFNIDQYAGLGDPTTRLGAAFEDWFLGRARFLPYNVFMNYKKYHNGSKWHTGVAYGVYKDFAAVTRDKPGVPNPPKVEFIKNVWLNRGGSTDD